MSTATDNKKARPDNLLFHSHIEICRILQMLAHERSHIVAIVGERHVFRAFLLSLDLPHDRFTTTFSANKEANGALLTFPGPVEFTATDTQGLLYSFQATSPEETTLDGQPAIHFDLPKVLLLHNRREHMRIPTAQDLSLRCVADAEGFMPFESQITDVSHDGLGILIYGYDIKLDPGAILKGSRIITPSGGAVTADLELRHISSTQLPDGTMAHRAGFHFTQTPEEMAQLIALFIQDMDKK
ncbi:MAG: flagellar regulator YcgR PilZN domain-containing protein [Sideroxydans sp.]|jgi:c-di-GMP-binding flagellar brake protein YcgR